MKYKTKIIVGIMMLIGSSIVWNAVSAQDFVPLGRLAQEYLIRVTDEIKEAGTAAPETFKTDTIVVNPDNVLEEAVTESMNTITRTIEQVTIEKERVTEAIKQTVKEDIDTAIMGIRKEMNVEAYQLQQTVDQERTKLFNTVTQTINTVNPIDTQQLESLQEAIDTSIRAIEANLQTEAPEVPITFDESQKEVSEILVNFKKILQENKELIESREGTLIFADTDADGLSNYDEIYIYKTDSSNARTVDGELTDGQKVAQGINPLSQTMERKQYQNPRDDRESFVSEMYRVDKVQLIKEEQKLVFEGIALPNSFITLYIFSTPIIVTVRTQEDGKWTYELNQELENGEHQVYVATVDSTGKIVARSNPILFTKTADAASIGIAGSLDATVSTQNFLRDNFILITLAILIAVVILGMMFVGNHHNIKSAISELKNEVNSKP